MKRQGNTQQVEEYEKYHQTKPKMKKEGVYLKKNSNDDSKDDTKSWKQNGDTDK